MKTQRMLMVSAMAISMAIGLSARTGFAQDKQAVPKITDKHELATPQVERLLLLMDTDKNGKISKQEWMSFMEAEFDRLDKDKSGQLDPKELAQSRIQATTFASMGK